jgi:hypothetical protein
MSLLSKKKLGKTRKKNGFGFYKPAGLSKKLRLSHIESQI